MAPYQRNNHRPEDHRNQQHHHVGVGRENVDNNNVPGTPPRQIIAEVVQPPNQKERHAEYLAAQRAAQQLQLQVQVRQMFGQVQRQRGHRAAVILLNRPPEVARELFNQEVPQNIDDVPPQEQLENVDYARLFGAVNVPNNGRNNGRN